MPLPLPDIKYQIKLWVNEQRVPMKPYVSNTLGNLCTAFLIELRGFNPNSITQIKLHRQNTSVKQVEIKVGKESLELKEFVQVQMGKTLSAFISVLKKLPINPEEINQAEILIELQPNPKSR